MAGTLDDLAGQLNAVAVRLREIGEHDLVNELQRAIGNAVAPLPARIREGLPAYLPNRYAETLDADLSVTRRTFLGGSGDFARVTVYASPRGDKKRKLRMSNAGFLWHPLFGVRKDFTARDGHEVKAWHVNQPPGQGMVPGWFDVPAEESVPQIRQAVEKAMDDIVAKAVAG